MKIKERALLKLMLDALIESTKCLDIAHHQLGEHAGFGEAPRIAKSLDYSNRVIRRAMITLQECDWL